VLALSLVAALVSCHKDIPFEEPTLKLDPSKHYIHFDADITTRGALVEGDVLMDDFNVLGYMYSGNWNAEKVFATPNVFVPTPQKVTYNSADGLFSYDPGPKVWTGNRYSFFAYYPTDHDAITLFDNGTVKQNDPYIIYTLPISSDPRDLIDVMTASYIDTGVASSASVALQFRHRLSAIDVGARNYYEYDHDNDSTTPVKQVTIEIVNLEVNLTNINSTSAKIYLDHTIPTELNYISPKASISYKMVDKDSEWAVSTFDVIPNTSSDRAIRLVTTPSGENASSIMLLPQEELLHGALKLTYKKKYQDDGGNWVYLHEGDNVNDFEFNPDLAIAFSKQLIEGRRYFIELTFTSDAVSVNIIAADEWDTLPDVKHEFE
jgi:hypothetical protein